MTTLIAQTTIELPGCSRCGRERRSWDSPCTCPSGTPMVRTFAVCVVDGEPYGGVGYEMGDWVPPAWLTELTEPCILCDGQGILNFGECPPCPADCIDGRPAVEVRQLCDFCHGNQPPKNIVAPPCWKCSGQTTLPLGRGTVEHVLPVIHWPHRTNNDPFVHPGDGKAWLFIDGCPPGGYELDITVTPGQYVVLVQIHA